MKYSDTEKRELKNLLDKYVDITNHYNSIPEAEAKNYLVVQQKEIINEASNKLDINNGEELNNLFKNYYENNEQYLTESSFHPEEASQNWSSEQKNLVASFFEKIENQTSKIDLNNNGIDDKIEKDLNNNGIDDKLEYDIIEKEKLNEIIDKSVEKKLSTEQLPYDDFEKLGISKHELLNKFDTKDLKELMKMNKTNVVTLDLKDKGLNFKVDAKLSLKQNTDKTYSLHVHPFRKEIENHYGISKKELEELKKGSILEKEIKEPGKDKTQKVLFQLDKEINELIKVNKKDLELEKNFSNKLSNEQLKSLASGKTLTLKSARGKGATLKLDLNNVKGYTISTKDFLLNKKMDKSSKKDLAF